MSTVTACGDYQRCQFYGCWHSGRCNEVKAIEYHENGAIKRVEFYDNSQFWATEPMPQLPGLTVGEGVVPLTVGDPVYVPAS